MARSRQRSSGSRAARSSSKASPRRGGEDVEIVEEEGGAGMETGIALMTFVMIFAAWLLLDAELGHYGKGLFFK